MADGEEECLAQAIVADDTELLLSLVEAQGDKLTTIHRVLFLTARHSSLKCLLAVADWYAEEIDRCTNDTCQMFSGHTPLTVAATKESVEVVRFLLEHGASPLVSTAQGYTPLEMACNSAHLAVITLLLRTTLDSITPSNVDVVNQVLYKAFVEAAFRAYVDVVGLFIRAGVSVNLNLDDDIGPPLYNAIESGSMAVVDVILEAGADIEAERRCVQQTPLMKAAECGNTRALRRLLGMGADINKQTRECSSALVMACHYGHAECVDILIDNGANPRLKNPWGYSALFMGADSPSILRRLVRESIDLDELVGERGEAAIHLVTVIGSVPALETLLRAGADINNRTAWNESLTWLAAWKGHADVSRYVIQRNCALNDPSHGCHVWAWEYLPVEVAFGIFNLEIPRMLIRAGCSLHNRLYYGEGERGPLEEAPWVRLRREVLLVLKGSDSEYRWFVSYVRNACELKHICRLKIRRLVRTPLFKKVDSLPLPTALKDYLKFSDL